MADLLDVRIKQLIGRGPVGLSAAETELVERWRTLDTRGQRAVMELLRWSCNEGERPKEKGRSPGIPEGPDLGRSSV